MKWPRALALFVPFDFILPYQSDYLVMLSTMCLQFRLSFACLSMIAVVGPPPRRPRMLSMHVVRSLPLAHTPSIPPNRQSLSIPSALNKCHTNFSCLLPTFFIRTLPTSALLRTSTFVTCCGPGYSRHYSVKKYISAASRLVSMSLPLVISGINKTHDVSKKIIPVPLKYFQAAKTGIVLGIIVSWGEKGCKSSVRLLGKTSFFCMLLPD